MSFNRRKLLQTSSAALATSFCPRLLGVILPQQEGILNLVFHPTVLAFPDQARSHRDGHRQDGQSWSLRCGHTAPPDGLGKARLPTEA